MRVTRLTVVLLVFGLAVTSVIGLTQERGTRKPDRIFLGTPLYADSAKSNAQVRVYMDSRQQRYIEVLLKENNDGSFTAEGGETAIFVGLEWIKPAQLAYIQSLIQTWRLEKEAKQ